MLLYKILDEEQGWRRYQWLLERKYREWNLRWEPVAEPEPLPIPKKPEPKPEPTPTAVWVPQPKLPPIHEVIDRERFDDELYEWTEEHDIIMRKNEVVECRFFDDDESLEFRIVYLKDGIRPEDGAVELDYRDEASVGKKITARVLPPISREPEEREYSLRNFPNA
jgi:hypothetical protein